MDFNLNEPNFYRASPFENAALKCEWLFNVEHTLKFNPYFDNQSERKTKRKILYWLGYANSV